jgi:hypothetical protein
MREMGLKDKKQMVWMLTSRAASGENTNIPLDLTYRVSGAVCVSVVLVDIKSI